MSSARDAVIHSIRSSLQRGVLDADAAALLDQRIALAPLHTRPALEEGHAAQFSTRFQARGGSVSALPNLDALPDAVMAYLAQNDLPSRIALAAPLATLTWPSQMQFHTSAANRDDLVAVSVCDLGIAETGSLLFCSGRNSPTTHNFVPDYHIVVLRRDVIVSHLEDAWKQLRLRPEGMPRAVNIISGPSRTGDIEQTIQLGAHGPRSVHVFLL